jgi:hypothetical protein
MIQGASITHHLYSLLRQAGVRQGKVVVGSQMMFWGPGDLSTVCNQSFIRRGKPDPYTFGNFGSAEHFPPSRSQFRGANALLLILDPRAQYSAEIYKMNVDLANYALRFWNGPHADVKVTKNGAGHPSVCVVSFKDHLTDELMAQAVAQGALALAPLESDILATRFSEASAFEKLKILLQRKE